MVLDYDPTKNEKDSFPIVIQPRMKKRALIVIQQRMKKKRGVPTKKKALVKMKWPGSRGFLGPSERALHSM